MFTACEKTGVFFFYVFYYHFDFSLEKSKSHATGFISDNSSLGFLVA